MNDELSSINAIIASNHPVRIKSWEPLLCQFNSIHFADNLNALEQEVSRSFKSTILLDVDLPGLGNKKTFDDFLNYHSENNVIVITDSENLDSLITYLKSGAKGYCHHDISIELLHKAIITVAQGGTWIERNIINRLLTELSIHHRQHICLQMDKISDLTQREYDVSVIVADGSCDKIIAKKLDISINTVSNHLRNIYTKLGISGRLQLALIMNGIEVKTQKRIDF